MQRAAVVLCGIIAVADLVQPLVLPWAPKLVGAILGGLFYASAAVLIHRSVRPMGFAVAALPVIPLTVLALTALGVALPVDPDSAMVGILALQLAAAGASVGWLFAKPDA